MNILTASAIQQQGVDAIVEKMQYGPVHVMKRNRALFVVISENEYQQLVKQEQKRASGLLAMLSKTQSGKRTKKDIDKQLARDRDAWR